MAKIYAKLHDKTTMQFFFRNQMLTTTQFGGFFCLYSTCKCLFNTHMDMDIVASTAAAAVLGVAPFVTSRVFRRNLIWATALVGMDAYSTYTREQEIAEQNSRRARR